MKLSENEKNAMNLKNTRVLVTGATGFIGSRLAQKLLESGADVTILARKKQEKSPFKTIIDDLTHPNLHFKQKFDVVCHLASVTPLEKNKKIIQSVNYDGVKNLFSAVSGAKLFVYISGLAVFDPIYDKITETTPKKYDTEFVKVRIKAQEFLEENCLKSGMNLSVAYLGDIVYGNGGFFQSMIYDRIQKGTFRIPGNGKYVKNFIHVDDVIGALIAIIQKEETNSYILTDSTPVSFIEFINYISDNLGVKKPKTVPAALAKLVLGSDAINLLTRSVSASNRKISQIYDFKFQSYKEGLSDLLPKL
ncbi:MAG: nucleoside-diphosphate sugar epimerase [Nitrosopumilales archaeon CG15_BIG_FIL_POST_REV_8_21_14_020_33_23]|nr:MAG: nucleoside-diphosphate sugar epimerase [Nitrosopumilales archaeon CG15_BIG_FIL_POST_REV_8_21_14_020_33_23]